MKAVVFKGIGNITLQDVDEPRIIDARDAIVRVRMASVCGTDLHMIRGTIDGMRPGTILGHEAVGEVEAVGAAVATVKPGDRVIVLSTIGCGTCAYCAKGAYSQCDRANPNGPHLGTAFFGGPWHTGPFHGMQAEKVRVPFADVGLVRIPEAIKDSDALLLSDIAPTAYMAVQEANPQVNDCVAVFGCGIVGQLIIHALKKRGINNIVAIDNIPYRLHRAAQQGVHTIHFDTHDPVEELRTVTQGNGPDVVIDAVGVDANHPRYTGCTWFKQWRTVYAFYKERKYIVPHPKPCRGNWMPGSGPSQVLQWAVASVAKTGTLSIVGLYAARSVIFPVGYALAKNVKIRFCTCNHRAYVSDVLPWAYDQDVPLRSFITQTVPFDQAIEAYKHVDMRDDGWLKVALIMK